MNCHELFPYNNITDEDFEFKNTCIDVSDSMYDLNRACESLERDLSKTLFIIRESELFFEDENVLENKKESDYHYYRHEIQQLIQ